MLRMRSVEYQMAQSAILTTRQKTECDFQKMATALVVSEHNTLLEAMLLSSVTPSMKQDNDLFWNNESQ